MSPGAAPGSAGRYRSRCRRAPGPRTEPRGVVVLHERLFDDVLRHERVHQVRACPELRLDQRLADPFEAEAVDLDEEEVLAPAQQKREVRAGERRDALQLRSDAPSRHWRAAVRGPVVVISPVAWAIASSPATPVSTPPAPIMNRRRLKRRPFGFWPPSGPWGAQMIPGSPLASGFTDWPSPRPLPCVPSPGPPPHLSASTRAPPLSWCPSLHRRTANLYSGTHPAVKSQIGLTAS